jgi:hypothetical protein
MFLGLWLHIHRSAPIFWLFFLPGYIEVEPMYVLLYCTYCTYKHVCLRCYVKPERDDCRSYYSAASLPDPLQRLVGGCELAGAPPRAAADTY